VWALHLSCQHCRLQLLWLLVRLCALVPMLLDLPLRTSLSYTQTAACCYLLANAKSAS
jgi:hypothetical protein